MAITDYHSILFYGEYYFMEILWRTGDLPLYILDRLFDSFSDESLSDVDDQNNDDVGELYIGIQLCSATAKTLKSWQPSWIAGYHDNEM